MHVSPPSINSSPTQPCLQYWPEPGLQQFGPMTVELLSRTADDDVIIRLFRIQNITRVGGRRRKRKQALSGWVSSDLEPRKSFRMTCVSLQMLTCIITFSRMFSEIIYDGDMNAACVKKYAKYIICGSQDLMFLFLQH